MIKMETKAELLKQLGFSDKFVNEVENTPVENNYEDSANVFTCFDTYDTSELDLTSIIIEKTEIPINLTAVYTTE